MALAMALILAMLFTACKNEEAPEEPKATETQKTQEETNTSQQNTQSAQQTASPQTAENTAQSGELTDREKQLMENINDVALIDFTLPDFDGNEHSLSDYKGNVIILNFWAIGCPPCVDELPDFDRVAQRDGVVLVTLAQKNILGNQKEKSGEFIKQFDTVALWDEQVETMKLYPSQYYPHTYIIDRSGTIRFVLNSASYELMDELVTFVDEHFN